MPQPSGKRRPKSRYFKERKHGPIIVFHFKNKIMRSILYVIAVILVIGWGIGFLGYHAGGIIHILLVIALISILLGVIRRA